ncbi:hypothetical protein J2046_001557 [Rhizobium petrolearium]|nr:hypothetical protein [Neorhizobium petrolearium]
MTAADAWLQSEKDRNARCYSSKITENASIVGEEDTLNDSGPIV